MDTVVCRISVYRIEIELGGHDKQSLFLAAAETADLALNEPVLDSFPSPPMVSAFVVRLKTLLATVGRRGQANAQFGFWCCGSEGRQKRVCLDHHGVDPGIDRIWVFRIGTETVVDAEQEEDEVRTLAAAFLVKVTFHIQNRFSVWLRIDERTAPFSVRSVRIRLVLRNEPLPRPAAVTFVCDALCSP